jgi:hypothetical protein
MTRGARFIRWKMGAWCADAAHRFNRPDLLDKRTPLAVRFEAAVALLLDA